MNFLKKEYLVCIMTILFMSLLISCTDAKQQTNDSDEKSVPKVTTTSYIQKNDTEKSAGSKTKATTTTTEAATTTTATTTTVTTTCTEATTTLYSEEPGALVKTYNYERKFDGLESYLTKTEYYENQVVIYGSLRHGGSIKCYTSDFELIQHLGSEYSQEDNKLIIYSDQAEKISGVTIEKENADIRIRYLDTEQYGMLEYRHITEYGKVPYGTGEYYYTQEEKDKKSISEYRKEKNAEKCLAILEGVWENEEKTMRMEVTDKILFYANNNGAWELSREFSFIPRNSYSINFGYDIDRNMMSISVDYPVQGMVTNTHIYDFYINDNFNELELIDENEDVIKKLYKQ